MFLFSRSVSELWKHNKFWGRYANELFAASSHLFGSIWILFIAQFELQIYVLMGFIFNLMVECDPAESQVRWWLNEISHRCLRQSLILMLTLSSWEIHRICLKVSREFFSQRLQSLHTLTFLSAILSCTALYWGGWDDGMSIFVSSLLLRFSSSSPSKSTL